MQISSYQKDFCRLQAWKIRQSFYKYFGDCLFITRGNTSLPASVKHPFTIYLYRYR